MANSAKEWREAREKGIEQVFPSGLVAAIRPIEVDAFVVFGHIPDSMAHLVNRMINGEFIAPEELVAPSHEEIQKSEEWRKFLNELAIYAFVSPEVREVPENDNQISVWDVSYGDKVFLYHFFARPAGYLRSFRDFKAQPVEPVDAAANDGATSQQDPGDQPVGKSHHRTARHVDRATA